MTKAYAVVYEEEYVKHVNAFNVIFNHRFLQSKVHPGGEVYVVSFFLVIFVNKS